MFDETASIGSILLIMLVYKDIECFKPFERLGRFNVEDIDQCIGHDTE